MRFRMLGPLEIFDGESWTQLSSTKVRSLLAFLLLNANVAVSVDRLADELWEGHAPRAAANLVQQYVLRLRRALGATGGGPCELVLTRPGGYELVLADPAELDAARFASLLSDGQAALRAGEAERAAAALVEALDLWRGPAFADVPPTPVIEAEAARLEEQRMTALEDRIEAELACGRGSSLVAELRKLVRDQPLRERTWGQLMLALYRSGRQADALAAYREVQRLLDTELAVEPGAELARLHHQILTADPALAPPPPPELADAPGPVPRQLPAALPTFAGRRGELDRALALLPAGTGSPGTVVISAIDGMAGIGKTTLAVHLAHQVADRFPDGQLYVNLRGFDPTGPAVHPTEVLRSFLTALGVAPAQLPSDPAALSGRYRSQLADRRVLVVLDNARDADQVRPLLPGGSTCLVVVTSRNQLTSLVATAGAHPLTVGLLSVEEAHQLLARRLGPDRVAAEPHAVDEIIALCGRLPLALAIVAARAAIRPTFRLAALAGELRAAHGRLDALAGADAGADLRTAFSWSYDALGPAPARLFRLLGLAAGADISAPAAASLAATTATRARRLLAELTRASLLTEHAPGQYTWHDLIGSYAAELVGMHEAEDQRRAALHRQFDHYLHTAHAAAQLLHPQTDPIELGPPPSLVTPEPVTDHDQAMAWFTTERVGLVAIVDQAARTGFDVHAWQLAWTLTDFLDRRGHWPDLMVTQRAALAAAQRLGDRPKQALSHRFLGLAHHWLGRDADAGSHFRHALDLLGELGDHTGQAHTHLALCWLYERQERPAQALHHAQRALELFERAGHVVGQANALNAIGWYHGLLGEHRQTLDYCERALALQREVSDRVGEAATWDSLGYAHHHLGAYRQAVDCYRRGLALYGELGDRYFAALVHTHLGDTQLAAGDRRAARETWQRALEILHELDHPDAGDVRAKLERLDQPAGADPR